MDDRARARLRASMTMALAALVATAGVASGAEAAAKPLLVRLKDTAISPARIHLGWGLSGTVPKSAKTATIGKTQLVFVDLDGDGAIGSAGDAMMWPPSPFALPIPAKLLLPDGQFAIAWDAGGLKLVAETLSIPPPVLAQAAEMNLIRAAAGVRPVYLDAKSCEACAKHIAYIALHHATGMQMHEEAAGQPGYTAEGADAGRASDLYPEAPDLHTALWGWYRSAWHGSPMVDPTLASIGVGFASGTAMLYLSSFDGGHARSFVHPIDGAAGIPTSFGEGGEIPNPVPGTEYARGCGMPVLVILGDDLRGHALVEALVAASDGKPVAGTSSCPEHPANKDWPTNSGCAVFIPSAPLRPNTTYKARFTFAGIAKPLEWSFATGK